MHIITIVVEVEIEEEGRIIIIIEGVVIDLGVTKDRTIVIKWLREEVGLEIINIKGVLSKEGNREEIDHFQQIFKVGGIFHTEQIIKV